MEDKNIDSLFQERLTNLEITPNENLWLAILAKRKKKKRRILPLWWFSGGVAAILVLGLMVFPFSENDPIQNNAIDHIIVTENSKKDIEDVVSIKKRIDSMSILPAKKGQQKTIVTHKKKHNINTEKEKKYSPSKLTAFLVTEKSKELPEEETPSLVDKSAMKKIFLKDSVQKEKHKKKNSTIQEKIKKKLLKPNKDFSTIKEIKKEESTSKTWTITPVVGVLNANSFSNTSPIDNNLSETTQGNSTYSFGVQVGYQISNKWTIQTGLHLQEMAFSNNDVAIITANRSSNNSSLSLPNNENYSLQSLSTKSFDTFSVMLSEIRSFNGSVLQKYGYLEVPIEVKYKLLNSEKLHTHIVAGFSSLFLNKNEIDIRSNSFTKSGKVNNLNTINFSGNLGLDIAYNFDKKWSLRFNPMLKTQLNTFNQNSNNFKPYFIGIYTGISYRF